MKIEDLSAADQQALEAAVFRRLLAHLDSRNDVQNIDLMNLAGFCRNCLSKWYVAAAGDVDITLDYEDARTRVYGIPYADWKAQHQKEASSAQLKTFQQAMNDKKE
ncbi:MAG: deoxycytidine triphosphate deaminase [Cellvibrio sp. 79]|nr:MAG: deoxycytidine triphosphate deaminase [Cellvibrio sp. 79]